MAFRTASAEREGDVLAAWDRFSKTREAGRLLAWMRCMMREELTGARCDTPFVSGLPPAQGRLGIFVTILRKNSVRGCYGAFDHAGSDYAAIFREYLRGALLNDTRAAPLESGEADEVSLVITIADRPNAIKSINVLDIKRNGVIITDEFDRSVVYVPAEIRSTGYLEKKLAGSRIAQIAAFRAVTIREHLR